MGGRALQTEGKARGRAEVEERVIHLRNNRRPRGRDDRGGKSGEK